MKPKSKAKPGSLRSKTKQLSVTMKLQDAFETVTREYQVQYKRANSRKLFNKGPWLIANNVPRIVYENWVQTIPGVWKVGYLATSKAVFLYGDPSPPHARTAGWFCRQFITGLLNLGGEEYLDLFDISTEETYDLQNSSSHQASDDIDSKTPDFSLIPKTQVGHRLPSLALEVGYHNESTFEKVVEEANLWARNGVPVVIGIKIQDDVPTDPRLDLILKEIGKRDVIVSFGRGSSCHCKGSHVVSVDSTLLSRRSRPQNNVKGKIELDLFELRENIVRWIVQR